MIGQEAMRGRKDKKVAGEEEGKDRNLKREG